MPKNLFFGTLTDVKKAPEASSSYPSAYRGTVGYELRSKLKCKKISENFEFFRYISKFERQNRKVKNSHVNNAAF